MCGDVQMQSAFADRRYLNRAAVFHVSRHSANVTEARMAACGGGNVPKAAAREMAHYILI